MSRIATFIALLIVINTSTAQPYSAELEKRHGFKSLRLNSSIDSVTGATLKKEFLERDEFEAKLYNVKDDAIMSIGEVKVKSIAVKTYKDLIYEIEVTTEKDQRLAKAMEKALGKATYDVRTEAYHWRSENVTLKFFGTKNSLTLIYRSAPVIKKMYEDRGKKIETIAEDF